MSAADIKATIEVHLQPGAKSDEVVRLRDNVLYVRVKAQPLKGQANQALIAFLAQVLALPESNVHIVRGHTSRYKLISVKGISTEELKGKLGRDLPQKELF